MNVIALTVGVVVSFIKAGFGGNIQPRKKRNKGWFPNGIIDSRTQNMALSCLSKYSLSGMYSSLSPFFKNVSTCL